MSVVFVTGATGFIGSHLVEALVERGHEVRCLIRQTSNLQWLPKEKIRFFPLNTSTAESFSDVLHGVDIVFHLAGATKARNPTEYQKHNVTLTRQLLEGIKLYAPDVKRFVMASSQAAAGPAAPGQTPDETIICRPITHYGQSKLAAERLLALYPTIPCVILRPVSVYGPRDHDILTLVKCINRRLAPIIGSLDRRLTFVHVLDLVQALILAADAPQAVGQTYFVTDGSVYTWREIKTLLENILNRRSVSVRVPQSLIWLLAGCSEAWSRFTGVPTIFNFNKVREIVEENWSCTSEKLQTDLGFSPKFSLEEGLRDTIAWARQSGWL